MSWAWGWYESDQYADLKILGICFVLVIIIVAMFHAIETRRTRNELMESQMKRAEMDSQLNARAGVLVELLNVSYAVAYALAVDEMEGRVTIEDGRIVVKESAEW